MLPQEQLPAPIPTAPRRRPALWMALCIIAGVTIGSATAPFPTEAGIAAAVLAILGLLLVWLPGVQRALTGASLILTGVSLIHLTSFVSPDSALHWLGDQPQLLRARLRVSEPPVVRSGQLGDVLATRGELLAVEDAGRWRTASGPVLLRVPAADGASLLEGDEISAIGRLSRIAPPANPGEYDWHRHFAREAIAMRFVADQPGVVTVLRGSSPRWLWTARAKMREAFALGMPRDQHRALLQALLLGDNDELLEEAWADFRASGTAHHLSVSGTHIAVLAAFVALLGRLFMLHPRNVVVISLLFAICYAAMTRVSPPVVRSVLLCAAVSMAVLFRRNTDPLQCLSLAAIAMLLYNPLDLFSPGFQLSFGAVAGLMFFTRPLTRWFLTFEHPHDRMARLIMPPTGPRAAWHWLKAASITMFAAGFVAHAVSLPLIAIHFGQLNPFAVPASIIMAPIVGLSLILALLKTILCLVIPSLGTTLALPATFLAAIMRHSVAMLAHLPGAQYSLGDIPLWLIAPYAALSLLPMLPLARSRWFAAAPLLAVAVFAFAPAFAPAPADRLDITLLSVGNGACALVTTPDGRHVMVDCGAPRGNDLFSRTIEPYLRLRRVQSLDALLVTHNDLDHRSALPQVVGQYAPKVYLPLSAGHMPDLGNDVSWEVLAPPALTSLDGNDASGVIRLTFAGRRILFTGDIQQEGIQSLLRCVPDLKTDILIAPHHGSAEEATAALLRATSPSQVVASSSSRLAGTQRRFDQLVPPDRLFRTGKTGALRITISRDGQIQFATHRPR